METKNIKMFAGYYITDQENLTNKEKMQLLDFVKESSEEQVKSLLLTGQMRTLEEGEDKFVNELFEVTPIGQVLSELPYTPANIASAGKDLVGKAIRKGAIVADRDGLTSIKKLARAFADKKVPPAFKWGGLRISGKETNAAWIETYAKTNLALQAGAALTVASASALIFLLARRTYQSYLSKTAKACKGKKGDEKNECFRGFKAKAIQSQIQVLTQSKTACKSTTKPEKCSAKVDQRIHKKKVDLQKLMSKKKVR